MTNISPFLSLFVWVTPIVNFIKSSSFHVLKLRTGVFVHTFLSFDMIPGIEGPIPLYLFNLLFYKRLSSNLDKNTIYLLCNACAMLSRSSFFYYHFAAFPSLSSFVWAIIMTYLLTYTIVLVIKYFDSLNFKYSILNFYVGFFKISIIYIYLSLPIPLASHSSKLTSP